MILTREWPASANRRRAGGQPPCFLAPPSVPAVLETWRGIRRRLGIAQTGKAPLLTDELKAITALLPDTLASTRDRALLLLGFAGALRRSELVALDVADLTFRSAGLDLQLRRGKTDPLGAGTVRPIPGASDPAACPDAAAKAWLLAARLGEGPLFRGVDRFGRLRPGRLNGASVALVVKRAATTWARAQGHTLKKLTG